MRLLIDWVLMFPFGIATGIWVFSIILLPLIYGFPRSMWYWTKGVMSIKAPLLYLLIPIVWSIGLTIFFLVLAIWLPTVFSFLRESAGWNLGAFLGFWVSPLSAFKKSTRQDLDADFWSFCTRFKRTVVTFEVPG